MLRKLLATEWFVYALVGGGTVGIDFISYFTLVHALSLEHSLSKQISFILGGVWSFFANKFFTFRKKGVSFKEPLLFVFIYFVGFVLNSLVHNSVYNSSGIEIFAFVLATTVSVIWNYLGQKYIIFNTR